MLIIMKELRFLRNNEDDSTNNHQKDFTIDRVGT